MTADHGFDQGSVGNRDLVEDAVKLLLATAPPGWTHLHAMIEPAAQPPVAAATATMPEGQPVPLSTPAGVIDVLAEHQRRAAAAGAPWQRLVIDCDADGRLAVRTEPAARAPVSPRRRWPQWLLAAITVGCLGSAAVVFAVGWRWGPPPRLGMIAVPPPPPRQQEAFEVIKKWFDAENRSDAAGMRATVCAHPSASVVGWIDTIKDFGEFQSLDFPDAVTGFRDEGSQVWVRTASRLRPLDERQKQAVAEAQTHGGFFTDEFTLADENGQLKVCDMKYEPGE